MESSVESPIRTLSNKESCIGNDEIIDEEDKAQKTHASSKTCHSKPAIRRIEEVYTIHVIAHAADTETGSVQQDTAKKHNSWSERHSRGSRFSESYTCNIRRLH